MKDRIGAWLRQPLLAEQPDSENRRARTILLLCWLALTLVLAWVHVPWRDEARAWSLALTGDRWAEMFRAVQNEGHPFFWYILLRAGWDMFGGPEVLRITGLVIGVTAAGLLVLRGPFRIGLLAALIFSHHLGFEYTVISRNYGIAALIMLVIAAGWVRIRDTLWLGALLLLLCNTNVPSAFLAGSFAFYRLLELCEDRRRVRRPEWLRFVLNCALLLAGALLCLVAVYSSAGGSAASVSALSLSIPNLLQALFTSERSFTAIGFGRGSPLGTIVVFLCLLLFIDRKKALATALLSLLCLKLFFFFVYPAYYRHSALFLLMLIALAWIEADKGWASEWRTKKARPVMLVGTLAFALLMGMQTVRYIAKPITNLALNRPFSHAADLASILERPELRGAMLMIDPDTMGEAVVYQTGRPYWLIRQDRPARIAPLSLDGNKELALDRLLEQAASVYARTGRPVVIALKLDLEATRSGKHDMMFHDYTILTPAGVDRFKAATRKVATLRRGGGDEEYDVYVYPR